MYPLGYADFSLETAELANVKTAYKVVGKIDIYSFSTSTRKSSPQKYDWTRQIILCLLHHADIEHPADFNRKDFDSFDQLEVFANGITIISPPKYNVENL